MRQRSRGAGIASWLSSTTVPLRLEAQRIYAKLPIEWVDDALPLLPIVSAYRRSFHLILLAAVWMHLDCAHRHLPPQ
jgi:hypothetical protein